MAHCLACGAELPADVAFCLACGTPVGATRPIVSASRSESILTLRNAALVALIAVALHLVLGLSGYGLDLSSLVRSITRQPVYARSVLALVLQDSALALFFAMFYAKQQR